MTPPDLLLALSPVLEALERLGVRHFVGGSIASSAHGVARASIDADVVADLSQRHVDALIAALEPGYYVPDQRVRDAVARRTSFNVIHLETMLKVDVFVMKDRPHDHRAMKRVRVASLGEGGLGLPVASAEDIVLAKLEWFRRGGEVSERQWTDVMGVLRAAPESLDRGYLLSGARELAVLDLLERALAEAARG
ncbi:MAG: hypothetical protein KJ067_25300 [Vicinamibacteria bacterium]|nr:hypothetical protein [Vicinamibacteria bacterium]